ncbi:MAG: hypothetical protein IKA38_01035 [Alistipes sp.]|nr:hypothetical protein [Alistipes sp.]MBR2331053.1 hypothetical protein [Alistipes sp.]
MPRRRKIEIKASELECYETLVAELSRRVEFVDFDMASLRVWAYESYEQELKGVEKSLRRLDHWLAAHRNELFIINMQGERLLCKQDLAKALGIARPTLDRWLSSKWLKDCQDHSREGDNIYYYSADAIKSALEKYLLKEDNSN